MTRHLILDSETTGLSPKDGHRIIELACIEMVEMRETGNAWHWYFNPQREVDAKATEVHGITIEMLRDKPLFSACAAEIATVIEGAHLVAHNAPFDIGFLNAEFERCGLDVNCAHVTDTLALARAKHPGSPASLDALCKRYKIDARERVKHGAMLDCELLARVWVELVGGRQAELKLEADADSSVNSVAAMVRPVALAPRITAEEEAAHAALVNALGERAVWLGWLGR